jgi:hypothetical protein
VSSCAPAESPVASEVRLKRLNCSLVLRVGRVKEPDQDICVERYSRHSPRN